MSSLSVILISTLFVAFVWSDTLVQLNVNRPFNDVSEKFVSFTVRPEDLYKALDGPNRKTVTQMATMLGDSYIKFANDYYFVGNGDAKLRNPIKIIWKGFNRWTRAINWTMVIPVPYEHNEWDPMHTLKILNSSYLTDITDCVWQLGTDSSLTSLPDYANELNTFNLMVDTFKPYVSDWQTIGADIGLGSNADELRRYIDSSKDLNAAFSWHQPAEYASTYSTGSYIHDNDRALKLLLNEKVPVWMNMALHSRSKRSRLSSEDNAVEALRWAQTLGEAASTGFDAIFRRLDANELEKPNGLFYVSALFKKVMGSRVFPARPLSIFTRSNKLYTHCASAVSGGIAFMLVNPDDESKQITIRSMTKLPGDEYWQYILSFKKSSAYLNGERLTINSTLTPQIKYKNSNKALQVVAPGKTVGFWVMPNAELEHCQFTSIEADELEQDSEEKSVQKRYSSSDLLLRKLIQETALAHSALTKTVHRGRRYATFAERSRSIVLEDKNNRVQALDKLFEPFNFDEKSSKKREDEIQERRRAALQWVKDLLESAVKEREEMTTPKRNVRSTDDYFGKLFGGIGKTKKQSSVRKITEIRKPEKTGKKAYDPENFDEEEFFKKLGAQSEPEPPRVPDGDVHLHHITTEDGEELDEQKEEKERKRLKSQRKVAKSSERETVSEMKPLRLLPTEYYEALPVPKNNKESVKFGRAWNALLFPEPFSKKTEKKSKSNQQTDTAADATMGVEEADSTKFQANGQLAEDFLRAQEELARQFLRDSEQKHGEVWQNDQEQQQSEHLPEAHDQMKALRSKYIDYLAQNIENYFSEHNGEHDVGASPSDTDAQRSQEQQTEDAVEPTTRASWWDKSPLRRRRHTRALRYELPDELWATNAITKEEDLLPLGSTLPERLPVQPNSMSKLSRRVGTTEVLKPGTATENEKRSFLVRTVKQKFTRFVDIVTKHVHDWYNTFARPLEGAEATTEGNNLN